MDITLELLVKKNACSDQVELFNEMFPEGVNVTQELCLIHVMRFNWDWAAEHLLNEGKYEYYLGVRASSYRIFEARSENAYAEYQQIQNDARAKYEKGEIPTYEDFQKIQKASYDAYEMTMQTAYKNHRENCAHSFAKLYKS